MLKRKSPSRFASQWKRLTSRERLIFALLYYEGLTPTEAARAMDCTLREVLRTVETRLERLSQTLSKTPAPAPAARTRRPNATTPRRMAA